MAHDTERAGSQDAPRKPWLLDFRSSNGVILATVCVAIFTVNHSQNGFATRAVNVDFCV